MSKATIQMCMSTTGFGPQALRAVHTHAPRRTSHSPSTTYTPTSDADTRSDADRGGYPQTGYFSQTRRPIPRFDMNLKELFSEDETDKRSFSRISNQINSMRPPPAPPIKQEQQQIQTFATDLKISPQMRTHQQQPYAFDPNLRPPQTIPSPQQGFSTSTTPTLSPPLSQAPLPSPYQVSNQLPYNAFAQNISSTYPDMGFSDLDFLDSFPVQGAGGVGNQADAAGGLQDLGFGMGFGDGTHDFSDGTGFDLFVS